MGYSQERDGFFGKYTEYYNYKGRKIGESRERDGFLENYTAHEGTGHWSDKSTVNSNFSSPPSERPPAGGGGLGDSMIVLLPRTEGRALQFATRDERCCFLPSMLFAVTPTAVGKTRLCKVREVSQTFQCCVTDFALNEGHR